MGDVAPTKAAHRGDVDAWSIRPAQVEDVTAIAQIESESFAAPLPYRWLIGAVEDALVGVATVDGTVCGFAIGHLVPTGGGRRGHLTDLAVRNPHRRQGVGRALLRWTLRQLDGCTDVWLEVRASNHVARELYTSEGFTPIGIRPRYYADGEDALVLNQPLDEGA
jgi:ribosomal-protein-alanine N-acetyltransferase